MSIPFVRQVRPDDDGCYFWQCLSCYGSFNVRGQIVSFDEELLWKFCPFCGLRWEGERKWDQTRKYELGHGLRHKPYPDDRLRPLTFALEERYIPADAQGNPDYKNMGNWECVYTEMRDARVAFKALKEMRDGDNDVDGGPFQFGSCEYRVIPNKPKRKRS